MAECAALCFLPRKTNRNAIRQNCCKGKLFGCTPIHRFFFGIVERGTAAANCFFKARRVEIEAFISACQCVIDGNEFLRLYSSFDFLGNAFGWLGGMTVSNTFMGSF